MSNRDANTLCHCGSGKKRKKCHPGRPKQLLSLKSRHEQPSDVPSVVIEGSVFELNSTPADQVCPAPEVLSPVLYKFMESKHAKLLLEEGRLRIGTLKDFRAQEKHKKGIGDYGEGTETRIVTGPRSMVREDNWVSKFIGADAQVKDSVFGRNLNAFVFCFTEDKLADCFQEYDACIEIPDPLAFVDAITGELNARGYDVKSLGLGKCRYDSRYA